MGKLQRFLFAILGILLLVIGAEIYIYQNIEIIKTPSKTINTKTMKEEQNEIVIRAIEKEIITSAILKRRFEGVINKIVFSQDEKEYRVVNGKLPSSNQQYKAALYIGLTGLEKKEQHNLLYNKNELANAKYYILNIKNQNIKIEGSQLKINDHIIIEEVINLKKEVGSRVEELTFYVVSQ